MTEKNNLIVLDFKKTKKIDPSIKKEIGKRFRRFRDAIKKTQTDLARELSVYQSTITNIEVGKTFPNMKYLIYFLHTYGLNPTWLLSNKGDIFIKVDEQPTENDSLLICHIPKKDPRYKKYVELIDLMEVPEVEQIILAKIVELKVFAKEEIKKFLEEKGRCLGSTKE